MSTKALMQIFDRQLAAASPASHVAPKPNRVE
jgi:hypothetical protein